MQTFMRTHLAVVLALGLTAAPAAAEKLTLSFGVYAADKPSTMVKRFRPILDVLEQRLKEIRETPVSIQLQVAATYERGVADLVEGRVDFGQVGPSSYVEAKQANPDISILALEANEGTKVFRGIICVAKNSDIRSISDLRDRTFAFGSERSTIGRYLSQLYLLRFNIRGSDLRRFEYLDRHDKVGYAVGSGLFDAGALKEGTFAKLVESGVPLRAIGTFPNVTKPWIARGGLDSDLKEALRTALFRINDEKALRALSKDGFIEGSDADYAFIREAMLSNHLFFQPSGAVDTPSN